MGLAMNSTHQGLLSAFFITRGAMFLIVRVLTLA